MRADLCRWRLPHNHLDEELRGLADLFDNVLDPLMLQFKDSAKRRAWLRFAKIR